MTHKLILVALVALGFGVSQTSTEQVYVYTLNGNNWRLRELTGLTRTATGWAVPAATAGDTVKGGQGIIVTRVPGQPAEIAVDTAAFYMWVSPPSAPGTCSGSIPISDQKVLATDARYLYVCVPMPDPVMGTVRKWGRAPLEFSW